MSFFLYTHTYIPSFVFFFFNKNQQNKRKTKTYLRRLCDRQGKIFEDNAGLHCASDRPKGGGCCNHAFDMQASSPSHRGLMASAAPSASLTGVSQDNGRPGKFLLL